MCTPEIHPCPFKKTAVAFLQAAELPASDLTDEHMEHFFYAGSLEAPIGLVGLEFCGGTALLRSLVVASEVRSTGIGSALVAHAESYARVRAARSVYLLTTTAEAFFSRLGYVPAARDRAPDAIRATREFAEICPSSSAFMVKQL